MYQLYIANKNYSSWSLRPWVLMTALGIDFEEKLQQFESQSNFDKFRHFSPSGTVPCLIDNRGLVDNRGLIDNRGLVDGEDRVVIWDSLAIIEYLAEKHPDVWPVDPLARAFARCASAEMHSSFSSLRNICPMNCAIKVDLYEISKELQKDLIRIDEIWQEGLERFGGPFLAGDQFSAVDAFYCPVAFRVGSYQLPLSAVSQAYCQRLLALPAMQAWDAAAIHEGWVEESHEEEALAAGALVEDRRQAGGSKA